MITVYVSPGSGALPTRKVVVGNFWHASSILYYPEDFKWTLGFASTGVFVVYYMLQREVRWRVSVALFVHNEYRDQCFYPVFSSDAFSRGSTLLSGVFF